VSKEKANGRMEDIQQQLAQLRRRISRIDRKYAAPAPTPLQRRLDSPSRCFIEDLITG